MPRYARVNTHSNVVESVEDYDQTPAVADHERSTSEYVEIKPDQSVEIGHPLPDEARVNPKS